MKFKILVLAILCFSCLNLAEDAVGDIQKDTTADIPKVKDGYALLDSLVSTFQGLSSDHFLTEVDARLKLMMKEARASREANQIDSIFFGRFRRILTVFKIIITPVDKNELWNVLFDKELESFVQNVIFEPWKMGDPNGINKIAASIEEEVVNLQFSLDNRQAREELKKKLNQKMLPPPPPPGSKAERK